MAQLRRSIASEVETTVGSLTLRQSPAHLVATCALPTSTTAAAVILSNAQDEPQSIRLATLPRSERCRIRGNCVHGIALPSLAQAPVAGGAPGAARILSEPVKSNPLPPFPGRSRY